MQILKPYVAPPSTAARLLRDASLISVAILLGAFYGASVALLPPALLIYVLMPVALLAGLAIWVLPDSDRAPTRLLIALFYLYVVAYINWPDYLGIAAPGLPNVTMRRLFSIPLAIVALLCVSQSSTFRKTLSRQMKNLPIVGVGLLVLIGIQILTAPLADSTLSAVNAILNGQLIWTTIYFVSLFVFYDISRLYKLLNVAIFSTIFLVIISIPELLLQRRLWSEIAPVVFSLDEGAIEAMRPMFRDGQYRVTTVFRVSLSFAEYLGLVSPLLLFKLIYADGIWRKGFWVALDLVLLAVAVLTGARLGVVTFLVAHAAYLVLWALQRWRNGSRADLISPALVLAMSCGSAVLFVSMFTVDAVRVRTIGGGSTSLSDEGRQLQWRMAVPKVLANPIGYGPGQGATTLGYRTQGGKLSIDSYFLTLVLEYGVVGLFTYLSMFGVAIFKLIRMGLEAAPEDRDRSLAITFGVVLIVWITSKSVLSQAENDGLAFLALAAGTSILGLRKDSALPAMTALPR